MSDLISRSKLIEELQKCFVNNSIHKNDLAEILANLPTVEAKPVVHGEWVLDKRKDRIYCNHCNNYTPYEWNETSYEVSELISNFCPNCGTDMRKKAQE